MTGPTMVRPVSFDFWKVSLDCKTAGIRELKQQRF